MTPEPAVHTVFVPGLLCSAELYQRVLPAAWSHGSVAVADTRRDDTLAGIAERLLAVAPERFALVGLSMGGYIAFEVLRRAPDRVRAVALVSTSARPDTAEQTATRREQQAAVQAGGFDALVDEVFPRLVVEGREADTELLTVHRAMAAAVGPDVYHRQLEAVIARPDSRPLLPAITVPTAVVHGAGDRLLALENGEEIAAGIPGSQLTVIPGCGHLSALERPDAVAGALDALLRDVA